MYHFSIYEVQTSQEFAPNQYSGNGYGYGTWRLGFQNLQIYGDMKFEVLDFFFAPSRYRGNVHGYGDLKTRVLQSTHILATKFCSAFTLNVN